MSNKYEALLNAMDEGYFLAKVIFDAQGRAFDMLYLEANPAAVRMAGRELAGCRAQDMKLDLEDHWYELFARVAKTGISERHELPVEALNTVYAGYVFTIGEPDGCTVAAIYQDITRKKKAEESLRNREAELARTQRIGGIASIDIQVSGNIEDSMSWRSLEYRELHGLVQGVIYETHHDWLRRVHPSDRRKAEHTLKSALAGREKVYQSEYRIIRPVDGQVRWIYAKMDIERNQQGEAVRLLGAHIDITDRKRAERAAQKAEERYRIELECEVRQRTKKVKEQSHFINSIASTIPDMVTIMEWPSRKLIYINRDPFVELGFDPAEIDRTQQERTRFILPEDIIALEYYYSRFPSLPDGQVLTADYRSRNKQGDRVWLRVRGKVFQRHENGEVSHIINVIQNITTLKEAEIEAQNNMQKLEAALDVATTFLSVLKAIRSREGKIRAFSYEWGNEAANKIASSHAKRLSLLNAFQVSDRKALFEAFVRTTETGIMAEFEDKYDIDEHELWFRWKIVKYDDGVLVSIEDITNKRNTEQELMKLRLEQQREVLSAIIMTEEKERERIGEALHNGVAQLLYAVQTRLQVVTASSEAGTKHLKDALAIINEAIKDTRQISFELVPAVLKDYGIEVAIRTMIKKVVVSPLHIDLKVEGLHGRLPEKLEFAIYRIVQEMVNNIMKHARATEALVQLQAGEKQIGLVITDNGIGFKEAALSATRKGIGLQSVKNRVSLLSGVFSIRTGSSGTTVNITLPL